MAKIECSRRRVRLPTLATHRSSMAVFHWQGSALRLGLGARPPGPVHRGPGEVDTAPSVLGVRFGERLGPRPSGSFRTTHPLRAVSLECARALLFQSSLIRSNSSQSITSEPMHTLPSP